ncbi:Uncharacterised protein [uncultured archaeon]|nr:Uncharacterised protein [uncultured archaeon]
MGHSKTCSRIFLGLKIKMDNNNFLYDEFLICTVREADEEDKKILEDYVKRQEASGKKIYYPARDTNQIDSTGGYRICQDNCYAMINSQKVSVYWTQKSEGTKFDLGESFLLHELEGKKINLINRSKVEKIVEEQKQKGIGKSFEMVVLKLDDLSK